MSQEEQTQQDDSDFLSGFNDVRNSDEVTSPEVKKEVTVESPSVAEQPAEEQPQEQVQEEVPVIAGLTESEIKNLLSRVAKLDELETQVRKANGKIGELNGKLQEFSSKPAQPTQQAPAVTFDNESLNQWANDYPELVAIAEQRAMQIAEEKLKGFQVPDAQSIKAEIFRETQMELMDTLHEGWREKIGSDEFSLWINAQPENVRQTFSTTERAKDLSSIISGFDSWKKNTVDRGAKNKQRLEAALTPDGNSSRAQQAPTDEDEFVAGFRSIRTA